MLCISLYSLSHEAFDTNYGLFQTTPDQLLYPNPGQHATHRKSIQEMGKGSMLKLSVFILFSYTIGLF